MMSSEAARRLPSVGSSVCPAGSISSTFPRMLHKAQDNGLRRAPAEASDTRPTPHALPRPRCSVPCSRVSTSPAILRCALFLISAAESELPSSRSAVPSPHRRDVQCTGAPDVAQGGFLARASRTATAAFTDRRFCIVGDKRRGTLPADGV